MESVTEQTMTLEEAAAAVQNWQAQLATARSALAQHEQAIGQHALADGIDSAMNTLTRFQIDVKRCETGLAAAQSQYEAIKRVGEFDRVQRMRADADELQKQAEELAAFVNEYGQKVEAARREMFFKAGQVEKLRRQADEIERRLNGATA